MSFESEKTPLVFCCREHYGSSGGEETSYVRSTAHDGGGGGRIERLQSAHSTSAARRRSRSIRKGLGDAFKSAFLPHGYPDSVSDDYLSYQVWDSLQAFVSRLMGTLSTQAVLIGIGVGNEYATPLAATFTWLLRDGMSMAGRILFAWYQGTSLDYNSKQWRLFADVSNDVAFCFDLGAAHAGFLSTPLLCSASICRSLVEAAGGATRAAFVQHQAKRGNLADVAAKDGSQETLVNLGGLLSSLLLLHCISHSSVLVWLCFFLLTSLHLYFNYKAVRSICMETLNQLRLSVLVKHFIENPMDMPSIHEVNKQEPLIIGLNSSKVKLGCSFASTVNQIKDVNSLWTIYAGSKYLLTLNTKTNQVFITLHENCDSTTEIESSFQAHVLLYHLQKKGSNKLTRTAEIDFSPPPPFLGKGDDDEVTHLLRWSKQFTERHFSTFFRILEAQGWHGQHVLLGGDAWRAHWASSSSSSSSLDGDPPLTKKSVQKTI